MFLLEGLKDVGEVSRPFQPDHNFNDYGLIGGYTNESYHVGSGRLRCDHLFPDDYGSVFRFRNRLASPGGSGAGGLLGSLEGLIRFSFGANHILIEVLWKECRRK